MQGYTLRILNKIYLNKCSVNISKIQIIDSISSQIWFKEMKYVKEFIEFFELLTLLEQLSMQKPLIRSTELLEKRFNIKMKNLNLKINITKELSLNFFVFFISFLLSDRKKRNITENNVLDLSSYKIKFSVTNFKFFRKILWNNILNIENKLNISFNFKRKKNRLIKYIFYGYMQMYLKIIKKHEYFKK